MRGGKLDVLGGTVQRMTATDNPKNYFLNPAFNPKAGQKMVHNAAAELASQRTCNLAVVPKENSVYVSQTLGGKNVAKKRGVVSFGKSTGIWGHVSGGEDK